MYFLYGLWIISSKEKFLFVSKEKAIVVVPKSETCWCAAGWEVEFYDDFFPEFVICDKLCTSTKCHGLIEKVEIKRLPTDLGYFEPSPITLILPETIEFKHKLILILQILLRSSVDVTQISLASHI